jgi:hypothetical protein
MHDTLTRTGVLLVALFVVTGGAAATTAAVPATGEAAADLGTQPVSQVTNETATVAFDDQEGDGSTVTVASATLPDGGYLSVVNASALDDGNVTPDEVLGATAYLGAGESENVSVTLAEPPTANASLAAVAHRETNQANDTANATLDFVSSNGTEDVPYTDLDGTTVADTATVTVADDGPANETATVAFDDQEGDGSTVTVASTSLPDGGYVAIHDATLLDGNVVGSVVGASTYLPAGESENVSVTLDEPITESQTLIAMPHRETNQTNDTANATYDFVTSNGTDDGPYLDNGSAVTDDANVTVTNATAPDSAFDVSALNAPSTATAGTTVAVSALVENTGNDTATETVAFRLNGDVLLSEAVTLDAGASERVSFDVDTTGLAPGEYDHGVFAETAGETADIVIVDTDSFEVSNLGAPATATAGDRVAVNATVTNPNDATSAQAVNFRFDGDVLQTRQLSLGPNESETVTFDVNTTGVAPGTYIHGVFARDTGAVTTIEVTEDNATAPQNASITFDDQPTDGSNVTVASATNATAPFYVAVWTIGPTGEPETLLGFDQALSANVSDVSVDLANDSVTANTTLIAAVHPDADGNATTAGDADTETLLATDTALITVENATDGETPPDDGTDGETPPDDGTDGNASVTFDDQSLDGSNVTVAAASGESAPFYVAVWTQDADGNPAQLLGFEPVDATATDGPVTVALDPPPATDQTLLAAVHPDAGGTPDTATLLATDTASVTVPPPDGNETAAS